MKVAKTNKYQIVNESNAAMATNNNLKQIDTDLTALFNVISGRVRFGTGTSGASGENISGEFVQFTSDGSANTEFSVSHTLASIPIGYIVLWQDKAGELYQGPTTGTNWTSTAVSLKSVGTSVTYLIFLLN